MADSIHFVTHKKGYNAGTLKFVHNTYESSKLNSVIRYKNTQNMADSTHFATHKKEYNRRYVKICP
jgi:hypothetical protein